MPEEPDLTPEEIEELVRDLEERAARVTQAKAAGAPAANGRAKKRNKKNVTPVAKPSSSSA
jgi:hypothetical protein